MAARTSLWITVLAVVTAMSLAAGCSDDGSSGNNGDADTDMHDASDVADSGTDSATDSETVDDTGGDDATDGDTSTDDSGGTDVDDSDTSSNPSSGCKSVGELDSTYTLAPDGPAGQLYTRAAFDGEGVWVTWAGPESATESAEDIYAVRILCDGTIDVGPMKVVTSESGQREYSPSIDVHDGRVHFIWTTDTGSADTVSYRAFETDGTPVNEEAAVVTPVDESDQPISGLIWELDIAGLPGGEAVVVGSYNTENSFRVFAQRIDEQAQLAGPAIDVHTGSPQPDQYTPMVAAESADDVWISWSSVLGDQLPNSVVYRRLDLTDPQSAEPSGLDPHEAFTSQGVPAPFAEPLPENGNVFLAYTTAEFDVKLAVPGDASSTDLTLGSGSDVPRQRPGIAPGPDGRGGLVAWYNAAGSLVRHQVMVQSFSYDSSTGLATDTPQSIPSTAGDSHARTPYGPSVVHVGSGIYFIAWSEGPSASEARTVGRFVEP